MRCPHFDAGRCRSCTWLERPYAVQVGEKERHCRDLMAGQSGLEWLPAVTSRESGFRNKAKMVVAGTAEHPTLGILDAAGVGVDLSNCGLYSAGMQACFPVLADLITRLHLTPYDVPARTGELKYLLLTQSPDDELMLRFVLRSERFVPRLRDALPGLLRSLPGLRVVSVNLHPEHKAVLEGEREIVLTEESTLLMRVNDVDLHLRPQSFFQTNTEVAAALYRQARAWVDEVAPSSVWDLYSGVGGFALHVAAPGRDVTGIEISAEAVASARRSSGALQGRNVPRLRNPAPLGEVGHSAPSEATWNTGLVPQVPTSATGVAGVAEVAGEAGEGAAGAARVRFAVGDATEFALGATEVPDLVVVNPPRRGIGPELSGWLERSGVGHVLYSSCRAETLARDLGAMPSLRAVRARLLDMFPQTAHYEVLVQLERR